MKLKYIDGELYLDRGGVKVFFSDQKIPVEYEDKTKYKIIIIKRRKK